MIVGKKKDNWRRYKKEYPVYEFMGLSTDTKPFTGDGADLVNGCSFGEVDTKTLKGYDGTKWDGEDPKPEPTPDVKLYAYYDTEGQSLHFCKNADGGTHAGYGELPTNASTEADGGISEEIKKSAVTVSIDDTIDDFTSLAYVFANMTNVSHGDNLNKINTSNVTTMERAFSLASSMLADVSQAPLVDGWDVKNVTNFNYMFYRYGYHSKEFIPLPLMSKWVLGTGYSMDSMFEGYNLPYTGDNTTIKELTDMLLDDCVSANNGINKLGGMSTEGTTVDFTNWNTSKLASYQDMLTGFKIKSISVSPYGNLSMETAGLTDYKGNTENDWYLVIGADKQLIGKRSQIPTDMAGEYSSVPPVAGDEPYCCRDGSALTFYYDDKKLEREYFLCTFDQRKGLDYADRIDTVHLDESIQNWRPTDLSQMFKNCKNITALNLAYLNTSECTDFSQMFLNCTNLSELTTGWDTSKGQDFSDCFAVCTNIDSSDADFLSGDLSSAKNVTRMFHKSNIRNIEVSWTLSNVEQATDFMSGCDEVNMINLGSLNITGLKNAERMFASSSQLMAIKLGVINFNNANISSMFYNCPSLVNITVPTGTDWSANESITSSTQMFKASTHLPNYDDSITDKTKATTKSGGYFTTEK